MEHIRKKPYELMYLTSEEIKKGKGKSMVRKHPATA